MSYSLDDVARAAGVSAATVSRALRGLPSVRPATIQRIQSIAADMGYSISPSASSLASGRTKTVGLLFPRVDRWYFAMAASGAEQALRSEGFDTLLFTFPNLANGRRSRVDVSVLHRRVDAVILAGMALDDSELAELESLHVPVVFVGYPHTGFPFVGIDDAAASSQILTHLQTRGHERIAFITGPGAMEHPSGPWGKREGAWRKAVAQWDEAALAFVEASSFDQESGYRAFLELAERGIQFTAVLGACDALAIGALRAARERCRDAANEVSIAGIDDEEIAQYVGLTTVRQDPGVQARRAVGAVIDLIEGRAVPSRSYVETFLVERESVFDVNVEIVN